VDSHKEVAAVGILLLHNIVYQAEWHSMHPMYGKQDENSIN